MGTEAYANSEVRAPAARASSFVEGLAVDMVLEDVYRTVGVRADRRGVRFQCELIAWDPLLVAADRTVLSEALQEIAEYVVEVTEHGSAVVQAFPSHDDVYVRFEVKNEQPARRMTDRSFAMDVNLASARLKLESIGGEMASYCTDQGGARVSFWLPQWIQ